MHKDSFTTVWLLLFEQREKCSDTLSEITKEGETDPNEWVKKLSRLLVSLSTIVVPNIIKKGNCKTSFGQGAVFPVRSRTSLAEGSTCERPTLRQHSGSSTSLTNKRVRDGVGDFVACILSWRCLNPQVAR